MEIFKEIKLDKWVEAGEGNNSITYNNLEDETILLKLAKKGIRAVKFMEDEINVMDKIKSLNINTPKVLEKVKCNGSKGLIYERIHNKKSLGRLCHDNPQNIKEYAREFARETIKLHSTKCANMGLKSYKDLYIESIVSGTQDKKYTKKIIELIKNEINDCDTLVHGDLTVGNLVLSNNKWYFIDLGEIGYGDPIFDITNAYFSFNVLSSFKFVRNIFHMEKNQIIELWDNFIKEYAYLSGQKYEELCTRAKRISVVYAFNIWASARRHPPIIYQVIHHKARKYFDDVIGKELYGNIV